MISATSLPIAFKPCCDQSCHNMHPAAGLGLVSECGNLNPPARTAHMLEGDALTGGFGARLQPAEDLAGARVSGGRNSGWYSIKSRAEIPVGFRHAILFQ